MGRPLAEGQQPQSRLEPPPVIVVANLITPQKPATTNVRGVEHATGSANFVGQEDMAPAEGELRHEEDE